MNALMGLAYPAQRLQQTQKLNLQLRLKNLHLHLASSRP